MAPARRNPPPSETNYGSDDTLDHQKHTNYGDVIKIVDDVKVQRTEARKKITRDYKKELAAIKARIEKEHDAKREALSTLKSDRLQRLFKAIDKRNSCEEKILHQVETLRKDRDHLSLLIDAVYKARMASAKDLRADELTS
ncbi:hypothetical protein UCREL1_2342 [Eutypa lata UCREL1]|uniref:Uncharacterized protein n=1 Tax=Eutypa lata (strain UCR-EL1) TaxID=1287681 RepID=M7TL24_EUTLA|nr:hypothetical protein UCREL1_2342 [Eutypa lata UCREL1]